ncbi:hypothetical protein EQO05_04405 [Methanosarcina sp. MSH10X1]|uniref:hypothetical protein n=1 Tax=Methanosarcina sp. MSH10X1 TaxID=2507075 RepID=UPI000FFBF294|nr:hypothetical protein [Methanosarcina sp. MSH10X1]RXA20958.1 hypothetical protein EQO05_04405 [Methanosarcina sp. MSH10X1]
MKERKAGKSVNGNRKSGIREQNEVRDLRIAESPEEPRRKKGNLAAECSAYSTVFDALFLLVLISLASIVLMPSMQAEKQYYAAGYTTSSELDVYLLESFLSCKLEDFEYGISPLEALNISIPQNSVVENSSHALFGKEQKHRTFADLVSEYLSLSLTVRNNDSSVFLNPFASDYSSQDMEAISAYLDQKAAGRFSYRFEAYWRPLEAFPLQSELIIGEEPPANAIRQSTELSMPLYASAPSKTVLLACINDSVLEASFNSSDENAGKMLFEAFNASLDVAALEGAEAVTGLLFPSDYFGSVFGEETEESFQTMLYGVSEEPVQGKSGEEAFAAYFSDILKAGFPVEPTAFPENAATADLPLLQDLITGHIRDQIRTGLEQEFSGEINETVSSILEAENIQEARKYRDEQVESLHGQISPDGARIVLSFWDSDS